MARRSDVINNPGSRKRDFCGDDKKRDRETYSNKCVFSVGHFLIVIVRGTQRGSNTEIGGVTNVHNLLVRVQPEIILFEKERENIVLRKI